MDSIDLIVTALVTGATAGAGNTAAQAVKDSYAAFKALIQRKFGQESDLLDAIGKVESRPSSEGRKSALKEELQFAKVGDDAEIVTAARQLLGLVQSALPGNTATLSGSGAIAQGAGSVAAGRGGVAIGGDVSGSVINTGSQIAGDYVQGDKVLGDKIGRQINTGGGAYVGGGVSVSGGDFVGRDQVNYGTPSSNPTELSPEGNKLATLLNEYFSEEELRDICEQLELNWNRISAGDLPATARALVSALERKGQLQQLKLLMRVARPQLRSQLT
jgi:hypothetical protein